MIEYSQSHVKKVTSSFSLETFIKKKKVHPSEEFRLIDVMNLGVYFVVPLLAGLGVGIICDTKFGTKPIFIVLGLVIGFAGSIFNILKIVQQFSKNA